MDIILLMGISCRVAKKPVWRDCFSKRGAETIMTNGKKDSGSQFGGLPMGSLIGGPLKASAEAQAELARSTAEFIRKVSLDESDGKTGTVSFSYTQKVNDPSGAMSEKETNIGVPLISLVPVPGLNREDIDVTFDMEIKPSGNSEGAVSGSKDQNTQDGSVTGASINWGVFAIPVNRPVITRSEKPEAGGDAHKYHVDVKHTGQEMPPGLAKVLDILGNSLDVSDPGEKGK